MNQQKGRKKVVRVDPSAPEAGGKKERVWIPSPESAAMAKRLRIFAWIGWTLAIGIEIFTIFKIVPDASEELWLLLVMLIPIAVLAIGANLLWKRANRLNPASRANATRFFVQNQLGAIITVIAFLPLIIVVLLDKNMDGKQKGIVGGVAAVAMIAIAAFTGAEWDGGPSQEQYRYEENIIERLTGVDEVFWVKGGAVFHVCAEVPDVNKESKDGTIYSGTVADAHGFGKDRLTLRWESEAINHCGYTQEDVDAVNAALAVDFPEGEDADGPGDSERSDDPDEGGAEEDQ